MPETYEDLRKSALDAKAAVHAVHGGREAARKALADALRPGAVDPAMLLDAVGSADAGAMPVLRDAVLALTGRGLAEILDAIAGAAETCRAETERMEALRKIPNAVVQVMDASIGLLPVRIPDEVLSSDNPVALLDAMRILSARDGRPAPAWYEIVKDPDAVPGVLYVPCTGEGLEGLPVVRQDMYPLPRAPKYVKQARKILKKT